MTCGARNRALIADIRLTRFEARDTAAEVGRRLAGGGGASGNRRPIADGRGGRRALVRRAFGGCSSERCARPALARAGFGLTSTGRLLDRANRICPWRTRRRHPGGSSVGRMSTPPRPLGDTGLAPVRNLWRIVDCPFVEGTISVWRALGWGLPPPPAKSRPLRQKSILRNCPTRPSAGGADCRRETLPRMLCSKQSHPQKIGIPENL